MVRGTNAAEGSKSFQTKQNCQKLLLIIEEEAFPLKTKLPSNLPLSILKPHNLHLIWPRLVGWQRHRCADGSSDLLPPSTSSIPLVLPFGWIQKILQIDVRCRVKRNEMFPCVILFQFASYANGNAKKPKWSSWVSGFLLRSSASTDLTFKNVN